MRARLARYPALGLLLVCGLVRAAPPDPPGGISPPDASAGIPADAVLCVNVSDPDGDALEVRFFGRDLGADPAEDFTLVAIPDTQYYSQTYPEIFSAQTEWIVEQREALDVVFVSHLGDVVQIGASQFEWDNAEFAMSLLEDPVTTGMPDGIPYGLCVGNHDQSPSNRAGSPEDDDETTAIFNQVFGVSRFEGRGYYGGHYSDNNDSSYQLFSAGGMDFLIVHIEFDDTYASIMADLIAWADSVIEAYPERRAIVSSHALLCTGVTCPQDITAEWSNQGLAAYDALKDNPNLFMMICGHAGESMWQPRREDSFDGRTIHTMLSNYQRGEDCPLRCGNGYLRIYTFSPVNDRIDGWTYSPWLDQYKTDIHHQFSLPYDMEGGIRFEPVGSLAGVPSGSPACTTWTGREAGADYEWYVEVSDGTSAVSGPRATFNGDGSCDAPADCDDADDCTSDDCVLGSCSNVVQPACCSSDVDCDDGDSCTDDLCNANSCSHPPNTAPCSDGDACTVGDLCSAGVCSGTSLDCDDGNDCTMDSCLAGECQAAYQPSGGCCTEDLDCHDDDLCTTDSCAMGGVCANAGIPDCCVDPWNCDDGETCTTEACPGRNRNAIRLDGGGANVTMGLPDGLGRPRGLNVETFTVECWFKWTGGGTTARTDGWFNANDVGGIQAIPLVTKGRDDRDDTTERNVNYFLGISTGAVLAADFEEHATGTSPGANRAVYGSTPITPNVWHHAAATYDGNCWQLYLDGIPETDGTNCPMEPPAYESIHQAAIGTAKNSEGHGSGAFDGLIDEVRIWTRALGPTEIATNRQIQIESDPDLLARWALDTVAGFVTEDSTGNGHVGVIVGGTLVDSDLIDLGGGICELTPIPAAVTDLSFDAADPPGLVWTDQGAGVFYDIAGGSISELQVTDTVAAACLADDETSPSWVDSRPDPSPGEGHYYILRAEEASCGAGSYGFASGGAERLPLASCP